MSIDFRFDHHGLQHVTITGETPGLLRQLRLMHHELVQALGATPASPASMTSATDGRSQQNQNGNTPARRRVRRPALFASLPAEAASDASQARSATNRSTGSGLDIRL
ncbi:MAG: hypothetical protein R3C04_07770 [Hyphomonas sp.]